MVIVSLLIDCEDGNKLVDALQTQGIPAAVIGRAIEGSESFVDGSPLEEPHADELYRLYSQE